MSHSLWLRVTERTVSAPAACLPSRNALFKHLRETGHGEQAEAAERAAKAAAAIGSYEGNS